MLHTALGVAVALVLGTPGLGIGQHADRVPGDTWMQFTDVGQAGFDAEKLAAARTSWEDIPSSAFMVISDGAVVAAWGDVGRRFMCHSVRKSFLSALYGVYWDQGEIELNKTLADLGIDDSPDPLLETEKQARILDLLKARSGVFHPAAYAGRTDSRPRGSEGPGRYFAYNNWDFNTLAAILTQETGADVFEAFDQYFGQPLQMEDWRVSDGYYHFERDKSMYPAYPFRMSARDAARFGLLFARDGTWNGERLLSEHWVQRSTALYSIDNDFMGYGFMWWVFLDDRFEPYGAYAALGVGNQMIAVFPKLDIVIVNRADTYRGERTPSSVLADLMAEVLAARTGEAAADPTLVTLEAMSDPAITSVPASGLAEFVGTWDYPPAPLGAPAETEVRITAGDGHLVAYSPASGTFKLYQQADGSFHEEDTQRTYLPVRDASGAVAGIADAESVAGGAIRAAAAGDGEEAARLLSGMPPDGGTLRDVAGAVVDLLAGQDAAAERTIRDLAASADPTRIENQVNGAGYVLLGAGKAAQAVEVFELNTRVFPDAFNTWDSLGEGYLALGRNDESIEAYERSLELNPDNTNAEEMISRIRGGP